MDDSSGASFPELSPLGTRRSLSEEVFHTLRDAISEGRFAPGTPLREVAVARHLGVSATPVREALRRLEREGLVTSMSNRGTIVAEMRPEMMADLYELHETLEVFAVRRAAVCGPHDLTRLHSILQEIDQTLPVADHTTFNRLDLEFHRTLNELGGNQEIARVIEQTHRRIQAYRLNLDIGLPNRPQQSQAQHRELLDAVEHADPERAGLLTSLHITSVREPVLAAMKGGAQHASQPD
jgi:DNA-binding GntR family transcriptional regulator